MLRVLNVVRYGGRTKGPLRSNARRGNCHRKRRCNRCRERDLIYICRNNVDRVKVVRRLRRDRYHAASRRLRCRKGHDKDQRARYIRGVRRGRVKYRSHRRSARRLLRHRRQEVRGAIANGVRRAIAYNYASGGASDHGGRGNLRPHRLNASNEARGICNVVACARGWIGDKGGGRRCSCSWVGGFRGIGFLVTRREWSF